MEIKNTISSDFGSKFVDCLERLSIAAYLICPHTYPLALATVHSKAVVIAIIYILFIVAYCCGVCVRSLCMFLFK